jgi:hypothetical protein
LLLGSVDFGLKNSSMAPHGAVPEIVTARSHQPKCEANNEFIDLAAVIYPDWVYNRPRFWGLEYPNDGTVPLRVAILKSCYCFFRSVSSLFPRSFSGDYSENSASHKSPAK